MITKITTVEELKQMFIEMLLNKTDKISDIGDESVLNGIAYGCAKLAQRTLVNQAVIEGHIFPDTSYGEYLDRLAEFRGVAPRFGALGSSTYVRITAVPGTSYIQGTHTFISSSGIVFDLEDSVTVDINGYAYAKVKSVQVGAATNVDSLSINSVNPKPEGHISVTNEYAATGGRDNEDDELFRARIKESINQLARNTLSYIEQLFMSVNSNVLRVFKGGIDSDDRLNLIVASVNGQNFTENEFNEILSFANDYLPLDEILVEDTQHYRLKLNNVNWLMVDVDFRVDIDPAADYSTVRKNIQIQMNKLFDYRFWKYGDKVEWENMLFVAKGVDGVRYVPDSNFFPNADINVPMYYLPRIRSFVMRDMDGNIIEDNGGILANVFYPNEIDDNFIASVL